MDYQTIVYWIGIAFLTIMGILSNIKLNKEIRNKDIQIRVLEKNLGNQLILNEIYKQEVERYMGKEAYTKMIEKLISDKELDVTNTLEKLAKELGLKIKEKK